MFLLGGMAKRSHVDEWASLSEMAKAWGLSWTRDSGCNGAWGKIVQACDDKACLLCEIPTVVLKDYFKVSDASLLIVNDLKHYITVKLSDSMVSGAHSGKYVSDVDPNGPTKSWHSVRWNGRAFTVQVANARPKNMSWLEYMATGNQMSAFGMAEALAPESSFAASALSNLLRSITDTGIA